MNNSDGLYQKLKSTYDNFQVSILESFLFFVIIIFLGQVVGGVITFPVLSNPSLGIVLLPLSFLVGFGLVAYVLLKMKGLGVKDVQKFFHTKIKPVYVILAIAIYVVSLPIAEYLAMVVPTTGDPLLEELYKLFTESMAIIFEQKVAAFIMVCILAPILEEFIFRGIILRGFIQKGINPWVAILLSGFMFGLAHMNPWQFMGAGFLGIIFGFVYWRTQSLWLVVFLHFLNNFIAFSVTMYYGDLEETVFEPNFYIIIGAVFIAASIAFYFYNITNKSAILKVDKTP